MKTSNAQAGYMTPLKTSNTDYDKLEEDFGQAVVTKDNSLPEKMKEQKYIKNLFLNQITYEDDTMQMSNPVCALFEFMRKSLKFRYSIIITQLQIEYCRIL